MHVVLAIAIQFCSVLVMERSGVDDRLCRAVSTEDHQQVADHGRASLVIQVQNLVMREPFKCTVDHPDRTFNDLRTCRDNRLSLLSLQHYRCDFRCVGNMANSCLNHFDTGFFKTILDVQL